MPNVWRDHRLNLSRRDDVETQIAKAKEIMKAEGFHYTFRILGYFYSQDDLDKHLGEFYEYDYLSLFYYRNIEIGISEPFVQIFFNDAEVAMRAALTLGG